MRINKWTVFDFLNQKPEEIWENGKPGLDKMSHKPKNKN
jgi:hypothetical protein